MPAPPHPATRRVRVSIDRVGAVAGGAETARETRLAARRALAPALAGQIPGRELDRVADELAAAIARHDAAPGAGRRAH